jgi:hypothetical protein
MSYSTYSHATTPAQAIARSISHDEIVTVECPDEESALRYEATLLALLDDSDSTSPADAPTEVWGDSEGQHARVHIIISG